MIKVIDFENKKVAVLGLGRTGNSAALALKLGNAQVFAWDDNANTRLQAEAHGVPIFDLATLEWEQVSLLILSPGIAASHPYAIQAIQAGVSIVCDIELLARTHREANFIGITGTNGKSTTTWLISHLLKGSNHQVEVGGNIGKAALELKALGKDETYVLELSSYQLERIFTPFLKTSVLLNITPDHLERHGNMAGYIAAKERIFALQRGSKNIVISVDDEECLGLYYKLLQKKEYTIVPISVKKRIPKGVYVLEGVLIDDREDKTEIILDLKTLYTLPGSHNWQNIAAAYATVFFQGISREQFVESLKTFQNLPHRLQEVAVIDEIHFINDSKATNSDAAAKALACYDDNVFWILGGRAKDNGLEGLEQYFPRIQQAFLIGEAESSFAKLLDGKVSYLRCHELSKAVQEAYVKAISCKKRPAYVLLSPACASWDQFRDFEHRGEVFKELVHKLSKEQGIS
jgi:UDP-N-acetylmuramoylalanine--D-glutamate ligase